MATQKVKLGKKYRDKVSGFEGTAVARYEYLNGCVRYCLTAEGVTSDGKLKELVFDEEQLVLATTGATPARTSRSGGPRDSAAPAR